MLSLWLQRRKYVCATIFANLAKFARLIHNGQFTMDNGQLAMDNGQFTMHN